MKTTAEMLTIIDKVFGEDTGESWGGGEGWPDWYVQAYGRPDYDCETV